MANVNLSLLTYSVLSYFILSFWGTFVYKFQEMLDKINAWVLWCNYRVFSVLVYSNNLKKIYISYDLNFENIAHFCAYIYFLSPEIINV